MEAHVSDPTTGGPSRQHVGITATVVKTEFLDRSMEATCWNLQQFNPSPEIDSDLERALEAIRAGDVKAAERWVLAAIDANHREGQQNLEISGAADQLACELERQVVGATVGIKALCRELRPVLKNVDGGSPAEAADAVLRFRALRARVPAAQLTSKGVRRELGKKLSAVLEGLL